MIFVDCVVSAVVVVEDVQKSTGAEEVLRVEDATGDGGADDAADEASGLEASIMVFTAGMTDVLVESAIMGVLQMWRDNLRMQLH